MNEANLTEFSRECIRRVYTLAAVDGAANVEIHGNVNRDTNPGLDVVGALMVLFPMTIANFVEQTIHSDNELKD